MVREHLRQQYHGHHRAGDVREETEALVRDDVTAAPVGEPPRHRAQQRARSGGEPTCEVVHGEAAGPADVPFQVACAPSPEQLHTMTMGGMPMVYGIRLANGWRLQAYVTPGRPGRYP